MLEQSDNFTFHFYNITYLMWGLKTLYACIHPLITFLSLISAYDATNPSLCITLHTGQPYGAIVDFPIWYKHIHINYTLAYHLCSQFISWQSDHRDWAINYQFQYRTRLHLLGISIRKYNNFLGTHCAYWLIQQKSMWKQSADNYKPLLSMS